MKGAIAAGSKAAAEAGAQILKEGGNAVSAAIGACFTTIASEPALASLGGGGACLIYNKEKKIQEAYDFFANMPGLGLKASYHGPQDFYPVEIDFHGAKQIFKVGRASAAPSGALLALCELAESRGNRPLETLTARSIELLEKGSVLCEMQRKMCGILKPIYEVSLETSKLLIPSNEEKPFVYQNKKTADFLKMLTAKEWREVYEEEYLKAISEDFGLNKGGLITKKDLECFKTIKSVPISSFYRGNQIFSAPKPVFGGEFVLAALKLFEELFNEPFDENKHLLVLTYLLHSLSLWKAHGARDFLSQDCFHWVKKHFEKNFGEPFQLDSMERKERGSTTHVSVVDEEGTAVSITFTHGEGSGHMIGHTGIMMNNFVGEDDVAPSGFDRVFSGERLGSMIAPSLVETKQGDLYALGSGGSSRIRSAILQVLLELIDGGKTPKEAVENPRIHVENAQIFSEYLSHNEEIEKIRRCAKPLLFQEYKEKHLYFGGVHLVKCGPSGKFEGAGDPRRGGAFLVVC